MSERAVWHSARCVIYICVCIYIYIYICIHIYICIYAYIYVFMYVQREKEKETEHASEAHASSMATPRKILALPTGPQPVRACGDAPNESRGLEVRVHMSVSHVRCVVGSFSCNREREREAHTNVCTHVYIYIYICIYRERASERGTAVICKVLRVQREREM